MLRNQLALTEGLKDNQRAITDGFNQLERLTDMRELPGVEAFEDEEKDKDDKAQAPIPKKAEAPIAKFKVEYFDRNLNNKKSQDSLESNGYVNLPSYFFDENVSEISSLIDDVNSDLKIAGEKIHNTALIDYIDGYNLARPKNEKPQSKTLNNIENFNTLSIYSTNSNLLLKYKNQIGSGMFYSSPEELLHRFELLNGSLAAGNNGVLPEFIQIAHRLRDHGIITNNQLNKLLRKII